jgi:hypothetical protein
MVCGVEIHAQRDPRSLTPSSASHKPGKTGRKGKERLDHLRRYLPRSPANFYAETGNGPTPVDAVESLCMGLALPVDNVKLTAAAVHSRERSHLEI